VFGSGQLDVVFTSNLLEHVSRAEVRKTLTEIRRVLKPGGRLLLIQPDYRYCAREYFDDYTHQMVFSHVSIRLTGLITRVRTSSWLSRPRFRPPGSRESSRGG
jgi:predicted SAM-dependent methyltransferase